jgi:cytochrome b6-f complex iron-sulfur subunit
MDEGQQTRRSFLAKLFTGTLLAGLGGVIGSLIAYLFPPERVTAALGPERTRVAKAGDIPVGQGRLALVNDEPVWIVHLPSGFMGLSALCTHKGCIIKWEPNRRLFSCPCHAGRFDERGNVLSGLPRRSLARYRVGVVRGDVYAAGGEPRES